MSLECFQQFSARDVPQRHAAARTGHGQGLAVRRKGHTLDHAPCRLTAGQHLRRLGILERLRPFPGRGGPKDRRPVAAAAGQESRRAGSFEKSRERQNPVCPSRRRISRPLATSQTLSGQGEPPGSIHPLGPKPAARYFPSGENASAPTIRVSLRVSLSPRKSGRSVAPGNRASSVPASMSHSATWETSACPPYPTASRRLSVGENATLKMALLSPAGSSRTSRPVAASHRRTRLPLAHAIQWPSDEKRVTNDQP